MRMQRSILVLIGGVGALLVAGIVVALMAARQPEVAYPPESPEGTVATFLRLLQDGQVDQAYELVAMELDREAFHQRYGDWSQRAHRVTLVRGSTTGDRATVTVDVSTFSGGAFGASDYTNRETFTLERRNGTWRITGPEYLYF